MDRTFDSYPMERVLEVSAGFSAARALMSAVELGVFTELGKGPRSVRQLRESLGLGERGARDFLDALVALNFLVREGDDEHAVYMNTLDPVHCARAASFAAGLTGVNERIFAIFAEAFDLARYGRLVDLGGTGQFASIAARRHSHLKCMTVDLATEPLPSADVIVATSSLTAWNREARQTLIVRAFAAIRAGGAFVVIQTFSDFEAACHCAGFHDTEQIPLAGVTRAAIAYK